MSVLKDRYGFNHGDLHTYNVMFDTYGNLKLIDFGFSCITVNGRVFRELSSGNIGCFQGYDLAIFFYHFWYYYIRKRSYTNDSDIISLFNSNLFSDMSNPANAFNLFKTTDEKGNIVDRGTVGYCQYYIDYIDMEGTLKDTKNEKLLNHLSKVKMIDPKFLMKHFERTGPVRTNRSTNRSTRKTTRNSNHLVFLVSGRERKDLLKLLQLTPSASVQDVKDRYEQWARELDPAKGGTDVDFKALQDIKRALIG